MIERAIALLSPRWGFRSSITGRWVSKGYALLHPKTTTRERLPDAR